MKSRGEWGGPRRRGRIGGGVRGRFGAIRAGRGNLDRSGASLGRSGVPWAGLDRFGPVQTVRTGSGSGGAVQTVWIDRVGPAWAGLDRTRSGGRAGPA